MRWPNTLTRVRAHPDRQTRLQPFVRYSPSSRWVRSWAIREPSPPGLVPPRRPVPLSDAEENVLAEHLEGDRPGRSQVLEILLDHVVQEVAHVDGARVHLEREMVIDLGHHLHSARRGLQRGRDFRTAMPCFRPYHSAKDREVVLRPVRHLLQQHDLGLVRQHDPPVFRVLEFGDDGRSGGGDREKDIRREEINTEAPT